MHKTPQTLEASDALAEAFAQPAHDDPPQESAPIITITISGPPQSGKSALAHMIRATLAHYGCVASGPDGLASFHWRRFLDFAMRSGLSVELVEKTDGAE